MEITEWKSSTGGTIKLDKDGRCQWHGDHLYLRENHGNRTAHRPRCSGHLDVDGHVIGVVTQGVPGEFVGRDRRRLRRDHPRGRLRQPRLGVTQHGEEAYVTGEGAILITPESDIELELPVAEPR